MKILKRLLALIISLAMTIGMISSNCLATIPIDDEGFGDPVMVTYYDEDGIEIPSLSEEGYAGETAIIDSTYSVEGKLLIGWTSSYGADDIEYSPGDKITLSSNLSLYAKMFTITGIAAVSVDGQDTVYPEGEAELVDVLISAGNKEVAVRLFRDVLLNDTLCIYSSTSDPTNRTINIDLSGHTILGSANKTLFALAKYSTINIYDSKTDGKILLGQDGKLCTLGTGSRVNLTSGTYNFAPFAYMDNEYDARLNSKYDESSDNYWSVYKKEGNAIFSISDGNSEKSFENIDTLSDVIASFPTYTKIKILDNVSSYRRINFLQGKSDSYNEYEIDFGNYTYEYSGEGDGFRLLSFSTLTLTGSGLYDGTFITNTKSLHIVGGAYTSDPTAYVDASLYYVDEDASSGRMIYTIKSVSTSGFDVYYDGHRQNFETFEEAVNKVNALNSAGTANAKIVMLSDANASARMNFTTEGRLTDDLSTKDITIDLNGHTYSCSYNTGAFGMSSHGTLRIIDSSKEGSGKVLMSSGDKKTKYFAYAAVDNNNQNIIATSNIYVYGGTFENLTTFRRTFTDDLTGVTLGYAGYIRLYGGRYNIDPSSYTPYKTTKNGDFYEILPSTDTLVTIDGVSSEYAFTDAMQMIASLDTADGDITVDVKLLADTCLYYNTLIIPSGVTLNMDLAGFNLGRSAEMMEGFFAVCGTLNICDSVGGGIITSTELEEKFDKTSEFYRVAYLADDNATINVYGGKFYSYSTYDFEMSFDSATIYGGYFMLSISQYDIPDGYIEVSSDDADFPYTVKKPRKIDPSEYVFVDANGTGYDNIGEAITFGTGNNGITPLYLVKDVEMVVIPSGAKVLLNLNGHKAGSIENSGNLTITNCDAGNTDFEMGQSGEIGGEGDWSIKSNIGSNTYLMPIEGYDLCVGGILKGSESSYYIGLGTKFDKIDILEASGFDDCIYIVDKPFDFSVVTEGVCISKISDSKYGYMADRLLIEVEYNLNGGSFQDELNVPQTFKIGQNAISYEFPTPVKSGLIFKGWSYSESEEDIFESYDTQSGVTTICAIFGEPILEVNGTPYTLTDAISKAKELSTATGYPEVVIKLTSDITLTSRVDLGSSTTSTALRKTNFVLDLNGYNITKEGDSFTNSGLIIFNGTLTIRGEGTVTDKTDNEAKYRSIVTARKGAALYVDGGNYVGFTHAAHNASTTSGNEGAGAFLISGTFSFDPEHSDASSYTKCYVNDGSISTANGDGTFTVAIYIPEETEISNLTISGNVGETLGLTVSVRIVPGKDDVFEGDFSYRNPDSGLRVHLTPKVNGNTYTVSINDIYLYNIANNLMIMADDYVIANISVLDYYLALYEQYPEDEKLLTFIANTIVFTKNVVDACTADTLEALSDNIPWNDPVSFELPDWVLEYALHNDPAVTENNSMQTITAKSDDLIYIDSIGVNISNYVSLDIIFYNNSGKQATLTVGNAIYNIPIANNGEAFKVVFGMSPDTFSDGVNIALKIDGIVKHKIRYSVDAYALAKANDQSYVGGALLADIVRSMYNYGQAAKNYKG